ncbi:MAG: DUF6443 domain-containing protein, partial [Saprospiraceae bacterium]
AGCGFSNERKTGSSSYKLSYACDNPIKKSNLDSSKKYKVSFWAKNASTGSSNISILNWGGNSLTFNLESEWKYYEAEMYGGTEITVWSGSQAQAYIDELRLHPTDALMTTVQYDDKTGQTISTCDVNNIIQSVEYDEYNRPLLLRDQDGNIIVKQQFVYATEISLNSPVSTPINWSNAGHNMAITSVVLEAGLTDANSFNSQLASLSDDKKRQSISYMDGLGRTVQSIALKQSPSGKDIISIVEFDHLGRTPRSYLPYTKNTNGSFQPYAVNNISNYYYDDISQLSPGNIANTQYPYTDVKYDGSPMNRIVESGGIGSTFRMGGGHTSKMKILRYVKNTDMVRNFQTTSGYYHDGNLVKIRVTDQQGEVSYLFNDKMGRTILTRKILGGNTTKETYTIYDDFGNVSVTVPPMVVDMMKLTGDWNPH